MYLINNKMLEFALGVVVVFVLGAFVCEQVSKLRAKSVVLVNKIEVVCAHFGYQSKDLRLNLITTTQVYIELSGWWRVSNSLKPTAESKTITEKT